VRILVEGTLVVEPLLSRGSQTMDSMSLACPLTVVVMSQHVQAVASNYSPRADKVSAGYSISLHVSVGEVCDKLAEPRPASR